MILALAGPSGVGKTRTMEVATTRCGYGRPVAATTRLPRRDEQQGRDYEFISKAEFQRRIVDRLFVDWDYTIGNYYGYGIEVASIGVEQAAVIAVTARVGIRLSHRLADVHLLFLDGDDFAMDRRLVERGVTEHEVILRAEHRKEEREHAVMFHERIEAAHAWSPEQIVAELDRLRGQYRC